jgi:hypothetical protein
VTALFEVSEAALKQIRVFQREEKEHQLVPTIIFVTESSSGHTGWTLGFHYEDTLELAKRTMPDQIIRTGAIEIIFDGPNAEPWQSALAGILLDWNGERFEFVEKDKPDVS